MRVVPRSENDGVMPQPKQQVLDGGGRPRVVVVQVSKRGATATRQQSQPRSAQDNAPRGSCYARSAVRIVGMRSQSQAADGMHSSRLYVCCYDGTQPPSRRV